MLSLGTQLLIITVQIQKLLQILLKNLKDRKYSVFHDLHLLNDKATIVSC